ncbi:MAG: MFS transporter [Deltaproteobacteria bacterium]|nr:MFS transporter [Deltaproteobacteria bacterium]
MTDSSIQSSRKPHRWFVFGILCAVYFFVYFHRVSTSVIAGELLEAFATNATALGVMSSMYFYVYAFEQPLVGYLSDRIGPKRVAWIWTLIAAAGSIIFGMAPTIFWASAGRALIGLGVGGIYIPALKAFSEWFPKKDFTTLTGIFLAAGNLGAIVATTPLVWMARSFGWRASFFIIAAVTLALALAIFFLIRDHSSRRNSFPIPDETKHEPAYSNRESVLRVLSSFTFWGYAAILFLTVGAFITLQGLWATPFLISAYDLDLTTASNLNMLIPIGLITTSPLWGWLGNRFFRHRISLLIVTLIVITAMWVVLVTLSSILGMAGIIALMLVMGAAGGGVMTTLWSSLREITPAGILGVIYSVGKTGEMYPADAFRSAFLVCLIATAVSVILAFAVRHCMLKNK